MLITEKIQLPEKDQFNYENIVNMLISPDKTKWYQLSEEEKKDYKINYGN